MIGAFTNPAGRQPVLFLQTRDQEKTLITDPDAGATAARMRQAAADHRPGPVVAIEPANLVDITPAILLAADPERRADRDG